MPAAKRPRLTDDAERAEDYVPATGRSRHPARSHASGGRFWYDFARFNLTGWSIVLPTLAGLVIGGWLDERWASPLSWRLTLMALGLFLGCLNAWYWIRRMDHKPRK